MRKIFILLPVAAVALSGCLNPSEVKMNDRNNAQSDCKAFGFKVGTTAHAQCVERTYNMTRQQRAQAWRDFSDSINEINERNRNNTVTCNTNTYYRNSTTTCRQY